MAEVNINPMDNIDIGQLKVQLTSGLTNLPVEGAQVRISYTGVPDSTLEVITTDNSGQSPTIDLAAPPVEFSLDAANSQQPYSEYTLEITAPGYNQLNISGAEIFSGVTALSKHSLFPSDELRGDTDTFVIAPHTLYGNYPPKIAETEIKPVNETGEVVLPRVVIPEYVVVHDGSPNDPTAQNYYVKYIDYIKNVASSEIYSTWPESTIRANVLAIMSFTLNRVYTEWYRNKGTDFTITSSTAFDHKWIANRNVFDTISRIVDDSFTDYLSRPNVKQPILTQYCDGKNVTCPKWMSQWGSKSLGDQGYTPIEILRYYYGDDMYINTAPEVSGIPSSWPGVLIEVGSTGPEVSQIQEQLNGISKGYPAIPKVVVDGIYGPATQASVKKFQEVFNLPANGIVDYRTWYKLSAIFVGVTRIAELN